MRPMLAEPGAKEECVMNLREEIIAGLVRCRLAGDARISGLPVDVRVQNGNIHVLGAVESEQQRKTLELLISGVSGVNQIITDSLMVRQR